MACATDATFEPVTSAPPGRSGRWAVLVVVAATLAALWPVCRNGFVQLDDHLVLARSPLFNPPTTASLRAWWGGPTYERYYTPLSHTLWGAVALVARGPPDPDTGFTLRPGLFHALNLLLHVGSAVVVLKLLRRLVGRPWPAAAGAVLFAVHPLQVEAVAWVAAMNVVLCGFLSLVAIWKYVEWAAGDGAGGRPWGRYALATLAFALALLAKPSAVMVPAVAAVLDAVALRRPWRRVALGLTPWFALSAGWAVFTQRVQPHRFAPADPLWWRPLVAADGLAFYLYKLLFPAWLGVYYGRTPRYVLEKHDWAYYTWLVVVGVGLALHRLRPGRVVAAGALAFVLPLVPVLGLVPFDYQQFSTVADRYVYVSMLGPALSAAWLLARPWCGAPTRRRAVAAGAAAVLAALGAWSFVQTFHWHDTAALMDQAYRVHPAARPPERPARD